MGTATLTATEQVTDTFPERIFNNGLTLTLDGRASPYPKVEGDASLYLGQNGYQPVER